MAQHRLHNKVRKGSHKGDKQEASMIQAEDLILLLSTITTTSTTMSPITLISLIVLITLTSIPKP